LIKSFDVLFTPKTRTNALHFLSKKEIPLKEIIPQGYIDIHSHLLPGIDDGVKTIYQSAYILEQFEKQSLDSLDIKITVEASAEYMLDDLFFTRIKEKDIIPLHRTYVLVEMSTFNPPINLNEILFEIKLAGYTPILAHPERYSFYKGDINKFIELKESGFLFQLNLLSMSGYYGEKVKNMAIKLLHEHLFDFAGSDVHNYQQMEVLERGFTPKQAGKISELMENNDSFS